MPELPEVETIRRQLAPRVASRTIAAAEIIDSLWCAPRAPQELEEALHGARIVELSRRGKYLVMALDGDRFLVMHLRMTGTLLWVSEVVDEPRRSYLRARLVLDEGNRLLFVDPRRFGTGTLIAGSDALRAYLDARLGPEPLDEAFTPEVLAREAASRRVPVKAFLLDQRRVAGIGNIYADEALFRARIHPQREAGKLRSSELERLHEGIIAALEAGIERSGASIDRYRDSNGARGSMQHEFLVHRRAGEPCPRCAATVVKLRAAGRGTYICPRCQRAPRRRRARA